MSEPDTSPEAMLRLILTSRVYDVAHETPLEPAVHLSRRLQNEVLLKREDLQPVFSYKLRGAYNRIAHMSDAERARGVIAASAGNHAQGVAFAARHLGLRALIVMPQTTPEIKVEAVRALGAEVVLAGDSYAEAKTRCEELVRDNRTHAGASLRRSARHRRSGHDRQRDSAPQARGRLGDLRPGRRRRTHRRHRQLRQGVATEYPRHRRRAVRGRRDVPIARGRTADRARSRRDLRRRRRGPRGRRDHVPHRAEDGRRDRPGVERPDLRRDQGRVRRHAFDHGTGGRARGGGPAGVGRAHRQPRRAARGDPERREHELRSPALRRRAGRSG